MDKILIFYFIFGIVALAIVTSAIALISDKIKSGSPSVLKRITIDTLIKQYCKGEIVFLRCANVVLWLGIISFIVLLIISLVRFDSTLFVVSIVTLIFSILNWALVNVICNISSNLIGIKSDLHQLVAKE